MLLYSKWITYPTGTDQGRHAKYGTPSPYFRKEFSLAKKVKKAWIAISALGIYKLYLNGQEVSKEFFAPGWVDYFKKLPLIKYDVTDLLARDNAIGVVLGDGWAVGHVGSHATFERNAWNNRIEFTMTLTVLYEDGETELIQTDESWKASSGEILYNDLYMGEYVDHRLSLGDFSAYGYNDAAWHPAQEAKFKFSRNLYLQEMDVEPIVTKHILPVEEVRREGRKILYDVKQNISGVLRCVCKGERGAKLVFRHGEILEENGALYTKNLRKAEAMDTYILAGEDTEVFRPIFTYHGFRYAEVELIGQVEILSIQAEVMYTDLETAGSFHCSNPIVNKIFSNTLWSQRDNFMAVPTDCPQRDERLGWTGDAQIFCQSAMYNMDCRRYFRKYLADIRDAQLGNGVIPCVAPLPHVEYYSYTGREAAAGWSESIAEIPWTHYKMYGDKQVIRENLLALKKLLAYYEADSNAFEPNSFLRCGKLMYGDWLSVGSATDKDVLATLYFAFAADQATKMCELLGDEEAQDYRTLYENIKKAFRVRFLSPEGRILSDTQSAYVIAYKFGIITQEEARANLLRKLEEDNHHLTTGFLGVKFLLPALCDLGLENEAYTLLTQTTFPGWGYSVVNGATTIWEHWDSNSTENLVGMNSFNHYSMGSCVEWMYEYCLGIRPDPVSGGLRKVTFRPCVDFSGRINDAQGYYHSPFGRIDMQWNRTGTEVTYEVTLPQEIDASFDLERYRVTTQETLPADPGRTTYRFTFAER